VTKKRKKRSSGSCTWELRKSKESCKHRLPWTLGFPRMPPNPNFIGWTESNCSS
jgi:hypothetical protein